LAKNRQLLRVRALAFAALALTGVSAGYRQAVPGYVFEFPRDHFEHSDFQTEWWYYTGNVATDAGHKYGFELVFFRVGMPGVPAKPETAWDVHDLYLAHLALTDIDAQKFHKFERLNRAGPRIAGASFAEGRVWNGNWQSVWDKTTSAQTISAVADGIRFTLRLTPRKPPVIHGENGVSAKSEEPGRASYYVSFTRLGVEGTLNGAQVRGQAWMDHEWFTSLMAAGDQGWDWFSIQLENGADLMLFELRPKDGKARAFSSGTYIDAAGRATHLNGASFTLQPQETWTSPRTHGKYPVRWRIEVPSLRISLECKAQMAAQELVSQAKFGPSYWEGAVRYEGSARGLGYLEMTGYAGAAWDNASYDSFRR
jgi:predicted secreted hydrolase